MQNPINNQESLEEIKAYFKVFSTHFVILQNSRQQKAND